MSVRADSEFVGSAEAARRLNVSIKTVYRYKNDGRLRAYRRAGRTLLFRVADVESLIEEEGRAGPVMRGAREARASQSRAAEELRKAGIG
jgi:excisionase family DNA binding protein